jgi:hypothetical protein
VHGNALIGLHLSGDRNIGTRIRQLVHDNRPGFRQTAAWVIGKLEDPELVPLLEGLLMDSNQAVRQSAENALEKLRGTAAGAEPSRDTRTDSVSVAPKTQILRPEPVAGGEPDTSTGDNTQLATSAMSPCAPDRPAPRKGASSTQESSVEPFNIHLNGRHITGA